MARIPAASAGSARRRIMSMGRASEQMQIRERLLQRVRAGKVDRLESESPGRSEVLRTIVDQDHAPGLRLRNAEPALEHRMRRLAHAEPAGGEERGEERTQTEVFDPVAVELRGLVVERHEPQIRPAGAEVFRDLEGLAIGLALVQHERLELFARERARRIE